MHFNLNLKMYVHVCGVHICLCTCVGGCMVRPYLPVVVGLTLSVVLSHTPLYITSQGFSLSPENDPMSSLLASLL